MKRLLPAIMACVLLFSGCADQAAMEKTVAKQKDQDEKISGIDKASSGFGAEAGRPPLRAEERRIAKLSIRS